MAVNYIAAGASVTAARMNALYEAFDDKLQRILNGKSFILAFNVGLNGIPADLMGRCFFFTDGFTVSRYGFRCPDAKARLGSYGVDPLTGLAAPTGDVVLFGYDHLYFQAKADNAEVVSFDDGFRIANVQNIPDGEYGHGLSPITNVSLFDHSLAAHYVLNPPGDFPSEMDDERTYYLQEERASRPEKIYRHALADLILEGVSTLNIPDEWNKYNFFRIHNLNTIEATVTFANHYSVTIPPLECRTVRRDSVTSNYREGFRYFFRFEAGDYRHYWQFATTYRSDALLLGNVMAHDEPTPGNSMCSNNVACPSILYDWIAQLNFNENFVTQEQRYAWFYNDPHETLDISSTYANAFAASPDSPTARLGDLIHHKGTILRVRFHKTEKQTLNGAPTDWPKVEVDELEFNGYETIVADFAAKNITVTALATGQLRLSQNGDADYDYRLIPLSTNLFKVREKYPTMVRLPVDIEAVVFDQQETSVQLEQTAPALVATRSLQEVANTRTHENDAGTTLTVTGPTNKRLITTIPSNARKVLSAVQSVTVSDLLDLSYFGNKDLSTQDTPYTGYVEKRLVLTPCGLALLFVERIPAQFLRNVGITFFGLGEDWELVGTLAEGYFERKRVVKFRGHGFGWPEQGRSHSLFWTCRNGRRVYADQNSYRNPARGLNGADYSAKTIKDFASSVKVLMRIKSDPYLANGERGSHLWDLPANNVLTSPRGIEDDLLAVWYHRNRADDQFKVFLGSNMTNLTAQPGRLGVYPSKPSLLSEHYNAMAQAVNQLTKGKQLDFRCLRFIVTHNAQTYAMGVTPRLYPGTSFWSGVSGLPPSVLNLPVPSDAFDIWGGPAGTTSETARREAFYQQAGLTVYTENDLPPASGLTWGETKAVRNKDRVISLQSPSSSNITVSQANSIWPDPRVSGEQPTGTAIFPDNSFRTLATYYSGFRWVKISDIKTLLSASGFPLVYDEFFAPYDLKVLKQGTTRSNGPFNSGQLNNRHNPNAGEISTPWFTTREQPYAEVLAFTPASDAASARWKYPLPRLGTFGGSPFDPSPAHLLELNIFKRQLWSAASPNYVFFHSFTQHFNGPNIEADQLSGPFLHFQWTGGADHTEWMNRNYGMIRNIAYQAHFDDSTNASTPMIVAVGADLWSVQHDWYNGKLGRVRGRLSWFSDGLFRQQSIPAVFQRRTGCIYPEVDPIIQFPLQEPDSYKDGKNGTPPPVSSPNTQSAVLTPHSASGIQVYTAEAVGIGSSSHGAEYSLHILKRFSAVDLT